MSITRAFDENIAQIKALIEKKKYRNALTTISHCLRTPTLSEGAFSSQPQLELSVKNIADMMKNVRSAHIIDNPSDLKGFISGTAQLYKLSARCNLALKRRLLSDRDLKIVQAISKLITPTPVQPLLTAASIQSNHRLFAQPRPPVKRKLDFDNLSEKHNPAKRPKFR